MNEQNEKKTKRARSSLQLSIVQGRQNSKYHPFKILQNVKRLFNI